MEMARTQPVKKWRTHGKCKVGAKDKGLTNNSHLPTPGSQYPEERDESLINLTVELE